jgi:hypothetical protein
MSARKTPDFRRKWTAAQVRALGVRTDLRTAGAVLGISQTQVYEAAKAGRLPFPVIKVGIRYIVPTEPLARLLGLSVDGGEQNRQPGRDQAPGEREEQPGETPPGPDGEAAGWADARLR